MLCSTFLEQLFIHLHEHVAHILCEPDHSWIPVCQIRLQTTVNERQNDIPILRHQADNVLVVPEEQRPLGYLQQTTHHGD